MDRSSGTCPALAAGAPRPVSSVQNPCAEPQPHHALVVLFLPLGLGLFVGLKTG